MFPATVMPDQDWWYTLWSDPDRVVESLHIEPGITVVDLGCGDGYFTAAIARRGRTGARHRRRHRSGDAGTGENGLCRHAKL